MIEATTLLAALCYLLAAALLYFSIKSGEPRLRQRAIAFSVAGVLVHIYAQLQIWWIPETIQLNILSVLSLCALVIVILLVVSLYLGKPLFDAGLVALPIASIALLLESFVTTPATPLAAQSTAISLHIFSSVMAFGVLSVAGVYAVFIAAIDHFLRQHHLNKLVQTLPALDILEALLFQLITAGFIILTISLGTGLVFVSDLFGQHLAHKTMLSLLAWVVFGVLLWGRHYRGWRGQLAVRLTLGGILILLLSYFGSKLVLELLLGRSWQT